ncbi:MAG: YHS domain-containing protein [Anaerolinea sp.]|jgi:Cu+-exporting ATPase|nr:YHS domain-containing protein [Anaerolinea sp.]
MAQVKDVVCGMMVDSETAEYQSEYKGKPYYFCAPGCKRAFDANPETCLGYDHDEQQNHEGLYDH